VYCLCLLLSNWQCVEAMDRIHRLGQRRPVQAIKLVIEDSIESRIVQLQEKKSAMVDATLSTDDSVRVMRGTLSITKTATFL
jgi:DNA repair protein RAD16